MRLAVAILSGLMAVVLGTGAAAAEPPKRLDVVLTPHAAGGEGSHLGVRMTLEAPGLKAGDPLVRLPIRLVGIPTPPWPADAVEARDDRGPIPLSQAEEPPTPQGVYRRWIVGRASAGDVVVSYRAPPRRVTAATNNGPLFDLREENGGFAGSGNGFFAAPAAPGPWRVRLSWDLSAAPKGSRGVWSLGEGTVETVIPSDVLQFSYYYVGPLKSYPPDPGSGFDVYWLSEPPFDPNELGAKLKALYGGMAAFFGDRGGSYRVFARQNPYKGTGGTGLARSFMFGYHLPAKPTVDSLQGLLAHEMAHTWPGMQGDHGETAWYSEGMAEYYSTVLSWRAGAISTGRLLETFNERATAYYSNPYVRASSPEAAKRFWTDPVAQTVPYGRGWLYLQQVDAAVREASGGRRSLDDLAKAMRRRQDAGEPYGVAQWLELVGAEIGPVAATAGYERMVRGDLLIPPSGLYAPCLVVRPQAVRPFQLGFARASLNDDRVVRDLEPGSAADQAGVRNGDVIVEASDISEVRKDETRPLILTLRRGDATTTVSYLPRGAPAEGYRWSRDPNTPDNACRF
ncbi:MAG: hypothetical protein JNK30_03650 [Phenylobacterium sp.]|uniref:M61 family metallopeptidase n=1 Tax=Phenylobacterium sp. TaxID=1871053 RepID=UPI001A4D84F3|nr:hypothetical protein [Phenylobacterium sp.]MBL8770453.1 hypothetical protein [Phenylobacterium sp.]